MNDHHDHSHGHEHTHAPDQRHPFQPDGDNTLTYPRKLEIALRELLIEKGIFVLPMRPEGTEALSETELGAPVTRESMIGVAQARRPG